MATKTKPVTKKATVENLGTETGSPAELDQASNNSPIYTLIQPASAVVALKGEDYNKKSRPPVVEMKNFPIGGTLDIVPIGVIESYQKSIKQPLLLARVAKVTANKDGGVDIEVLGQEIAVPLQASIANVLVSKSWMEDNDNITGADPEELAAEIESINHHVRITFPGVVKDSKVLDSKGVPVPFKVYDIVISKKPVI